MKNINTTPVYVTPKPGVRAFLDFEFNGKNGQILSAAIVTDTGEKWYEVIECSPDILVPWVVEHVMPYLGKRAVTREVFFESFQRFIDRFGYVEFFYNAHADRRYLDEIVARVNMPLYRCIRDGFLSAKSSTTPHNALADATAIVNHVCGRETPLEGAPKGPTERQLFKALWDRGYHFDARDVVIQVTEVTSHTGGARGRVEQLETAGILAGMGALCFAPHVPGAVLHTGLVEITPLRNRSNASITPMHGVTQVPIYFYTTPEEMA